MGQIGCKRKAKIGYSSFFAPILPVKVSPPKNQKHSLQEEFRIIVTKCVMCVEKKELEYALHTTVAPCRLKTP